MRLTLSVLTLQEQPPFTSMVYSFDQSGGTVGRHQRADWVLLDDKKFLSGEHFSINCDGKHFFVVDTSTNGTFINDSIHPLGKGNSHQLNEQDRIRIGEYVIICSISTDSIAPHTGFSSDNFPSASAGDDFHDPFFSPGGHFDSSASSGVSNNASQPHDPYAGSSKSSFVDPSMAGSFGQASTFEDSADPFFSSDDSFSPNETPFDKSLDENIVMADSPLSIHTPLGVNAANAEPKRPVQVPAEVFEGIEENEEHDVFDFLDTEKSDNPIEKPIESPIEKPVDKALTKERPTPTPPTEENLPPAIDKNEPVEITPSKQEFTKEQAPKQATQGAVPVTNNVGATDNHSSLSMESEALKMFLKGAGITKKHLPTEIPPETFEIIGHALKEVLQGTIDLLRARAETKNHLHLDRTIIGSIENNPLKFMPNAEQVIVHLLTSENSDRTYTPLDKALEEAFDDIKAHQFAMTVATQGALKGVIKQHFSPKNLADNIAKDHPISSKIPLQRQAKLWNMFESLYEDVEKEAAESFQKLLDNEIGSAYEKQLMELKSIRISENNKNNDFPE